MKSTSYSMLLFLLASCSLSRPATNQITTKTGLTYSILKAGAGKSAKTGQTVAIYESMGYLTGKPFYALAKSAPPIQFTLGKQQVIAGVDEAVRGMKVGEIRKLVIPPSLSKRSEYPDYLSADSTLSNRANLPLIIIFRYGP